MPEIIITESRETEERRFRVEYKENPSGEKIEEEFWAFPMKQLGGEPLGTSSRLYVHIPIIYERRDGGTVRETKVCGLFSFPKAVYTTNRTECLREAQILGAYESARSRADLIKSSLGGFENIIDQTGHEKLSEALKDPRERRYVRCI